MDKESLLYHLDKAIELLKEENLEGAWRHIWFAAYLGMLMQRRIQNEKA